MDSSIYILLGLLLVLVIIAQIHIKKLYYRIFSIHEKMKKLTPHTLSEPDDSPTLLNSKVIDQILDEIENRVDKELNIK